MHGPLPLGVADVASAGGIGHDPNGVTPGLNGITCHKIGLDGFACVSTASLASSSALGCSLDCHICQQVTHFIVTWRQTTASLSGTSRAPVLERQGRHGRDEITHNTFMSTACQIHVSGSFETKPIPSVAKHVFITVAYIDSVLCPTQALLIQKRHFSSC